jgi:outer membrane protein assembly factor BamB
MKRFGILILILIFPGFMGAETGPADTGSAADAYAPVWRQATGGIILGPPMAQAESVVAVCDGGTLRCYGQDGNALWTYHARGRLAPHVTRSREGTSYICKSEGTLIAVNRAGRELWRLFLGSPLSGPVVSGWDGRIFVPYGENLACYTAAGYRLWRRVLDHPIAIAPMADLQGGLVMVLDNGELLSVDPFGTVSSRRLSAVPACIGPAEGGVIAFHKNGTLEWAGGPGRTLPSLPGSPRAALCRGDKAAVTLNSGKTLLLSLSEGRTLWTGDTHLGGEEDTAMLYDDRGIYVLSKSGATGFTEDGRRLWVLRLRGAAAIPAFTGEGYLYSGGDDWILYAYRLEDRGPPEKRSLYGPRPLGNYGTGNPPPSPWADYPLRFGEDDLQARLGEIAGAVEGGEIGDREKAFTAYLMETGGKTQDAQGTGPQVRERKRALELLGYMGSRETIPFLADLFYREPEPLIRAAAAETIGRIGVDPEGTAMRIFAEALYPLEQDVRVQVSLTRAVGALCRFSGPPLSDTGVRLLVMLSAGERPPMVRQEARRELRSLRP